MFLPEATGFPWQLKPTLFSTALPKASTTGGTLNPGASRDEQIAQKLCQLCGAGDGNEMHSVFECYGLADLRRQIASIFQERQTIQQFMWQPDMLQVARFLDAGVKKMQEIDPDAGSNI